MDYENVLRDRRRAAAVLRALGNERRLAIACHLAAGERSVGELQRLIGLGQSALSQHLAVLRRARLVRTRREAQTIFYALDGGAAAAVLAALDRAAGGKRG